MKTNVVGIVAIAFTFASSAVMARGITVMEMVVLDQARGSNNGVVVSGAVEKAIAAPASLRLNSKVADLNSQHTPSAPEAVAPTAPAPAPILSIPHETRPTAAPEMDASSMGGALTLLIGTLVVFRGRRRGT